MQTFRIALIQTTPECTTTIDVEGIPLSKMKETIMGMIERNSVPSSATIHVETEHPREVYFRGLLSSLSFIK